MGLPLGVVPVLQRLLKSVGLVFFILGHRPKAYCIASPQSRSVPARNKRYKRPSDKLVSPSDLAFVSLALPISAASYRHLGNEPDWHHHCEHCFSQQPGCPISVDKTRLFAGNGMTYTASSFFYTSRLTPPSKQMPAIGISFAPLYFSEDCAKKSIFRGMPT